MLNSQNFFDQPADDTRTYDNILKVATDKGIIIQLVFG